MTGHNTHIVHTRSAHLHVDETLTTNIGGSLKFAICNFIRQLLGNFKKSLKKRFTGRTKRGIVMCRLMGFKFAVLIMIGTLGVSVSKQCRKLDAALSKLCGYEYTVDFRDESHFNSSVKAVWSFTERLGSCSKYSNLILCSLNLPRCTEDIPGPYLPCKRVCDEYAKGCKNLIQPIQWTVGACQLLPESDDPDTKKGYLGRCFEPPNFKPTAGVAEKPKCWKLVEPLCQGLGYNGTFTPENIQRRDSVTAKHFIGDYKKDKKCGELRRKFVCTELFLPCEDSRGQFLCRNKCNKFFDMCSSPFPYDKSMCMDFPDGNSSSGICPQTHWPRSGHWPAPPPAAPTTEAAGIAVTESSTTIGSHITKTTRKVNNEHEPTNDRGTVQPDTSSAFSPGSCSQGWLITVCLLVLLVFLLLAVIAFLTFKLYWRRRSGRYVYENRLYMSGKDDEVTNGIKHFI